MGKSAAAEISHGCLMLPGDSLEGMDCSIKSEINFAVQANYFGFASISSNRFFTSGHSESKIL
jgi:hypothetical protein